MIVQDLPAVVFKTPRRFEQRDKNTGKPTGTIRYIHTVLLDGAPCDFFADTDLTLALNGSRDKLDTGSPIEVLVDLELTGYNNRCNPQLRAIREKPAATADKAAAAKG